MDPGLKAVSLVLSPKVPCFFIMGYLLLGYIYKAFSSHITTGALE